MNGPLAAGVIATIAQFKIRVSALQQPWPSTPWRQMLENMLAWGLQDAVFVAPKRGKDFRRWLAGLKVLQQLGVAESDSNQK